MKFRHDCDGKNCSKWKYCLAHKATVSTCPKRSDDYINQETKKIPGICNQKPCYFDLLKEPAGRDVAFVKKLAEAKCPKVCPKYGTREDKEK